MMKHGLTLTLVAALAACSPPPRPAPAPEVATLAMLYEERDCFGLRDALRAEGDAAGFDFFRAADASAFNRNEEAVEHARRFLASRAARRDTAGRARAYAIQGEAHARAYRYADAARAYAMAGPLARDSALREDAANGVALWGALAGVRPQTVERPLEARLATARDRAGLLTVEVQAGGRRLPFVWDTGAGLSTISDSTAVELGFRIVETGVQVGTSTGQQGRARLAVAPELRIGAATVRNAVFLVFPAASLTFPQIDYQIRGIIGFPVIAALGPVTHLREGGIALEQRPLTAQPGATSNLCLDGMAPVLAVTHAGRRIHVGLDTGAQRSSFFPPFLAAYREEVTRGRAATIGIGGAGGVRRVPVYIVPSVQLEVGGRSITLADVQVQTERTMTRSEHLFANLGQDVFSRLDAMTLDFQAMQLRAR